ncbi:MAG: GTP-binding protein [Amphritea sp.]
MMVITKAIPTNIITGFLGVGKTTAIQSLLRQKPAAEKWAVLVNEFGEVGIDASLMGGEALETEGVFLREVPGGCMCCAAGLPMQIALNQLISRAKPDRLLIEPTGLGHPREVIEVLSHEVYRDVLDLRATITLVDARKVGDQRYADHDTFIQQLQIADIIVAHKEDLYQQDDLALLESYLQQHELDERPLYPVSMGQLNIDWLQQAHSSQRTNTHHSHRDASSIPLEAEMPLSGYLRKDNQGEGFHSSGWIFEPDYEFDYPQLEALLIGLEVERLKAVFITSDGIFTFNKADAVLTSQELDETADSRIEVIGTNPEDWCFLESELLQISTRL